jgi:hypothetical protein
MVAHGFVITELNYGACSGSCGPHFLQKLNHHFFYKICMLGCQVFFCEWSSCRYKWGCLGLEHILVISMYKQFIISVKKHVNICRFQILGHKIYFIHVNVGFKFWVTEYISLYLMGYHIYISLYLIQFPVYYIYAVAWIGMPGNIGFTYIWKINMKCQILS